VTPFLEAIQTEHLDCVIALAKCPALEVNHCDSSKQSALYYAVIMAQPYSVFLICTHPNFRGTLSFQFCFCFLISYWVYFLL
jgi:hypothetical protein